ncbi:MAG: aminotransferase class I/II-fold pyridoxal phosphate-dependent enzyme, partial [Synechococcaceae cyanobacterium]
MRSSAPPTDAPPWRERLRAALDALPPERRRHLRPFASPPDASALLHSLPAPGASGETPPLPLLDLASNDYLGLSRHPAVLAAAAAELAATGLGAGASRLVTGTRAVHLRLEEELAAWLGRERVLLFPSGFQA